MDCRKVVANGGLECDLRLSASRFVQCQTADSAVLSSEMQNRRHRIVAKTIIHLLDTSTF